MEKRKRSFAALAAGFRFRHPVYVTRPAMPPFEELAQDDPRRLDRSSLPGGAKVVAEDWGFADRL